MFSINFMDSILTVSLNFNNQKHLLLIDFIKTIFIIIFFLFSEIMLWIYIFFC